MSRGDVLLWVVLPYVCLAVFVVGHIWRYRRDQFTWTTRSTQLLERRVLRWGVLLFHLGLLGIVAGHILGILIPKSFSDAVGIGEDAYHVLAVSAGTTVGVAMTAGLVILIFRRTTNARVAATTTSRDRISVLLLAVVVLTGMAATVGENLLTGAYEYRETVAPWFRKLFILDPDASLMSGVPVLFKLHAVSAWLLFAIWPFTRLVHAWSIPLSYLTRSAIVFRSRAPARAHAETVPTES